MPSKKKISTVGRQAEVITGKPNQLFLLSSAEIYFTYAHRRGTFKYLSSRNPFNAKAEALVLQLSFVYFLSVVKERLFP